MSSERHAPREIEFEEKDRPLRDDVSILGALVGDVIRDQGGDALFDLVETARRRAIHRRESSADSSEGKPGGPGLVSVVADLDPRQAGLLVRSFLTYFRVVNLAEQVHRIRRRRDYQREGRVQAGSWAETMRSLQEAGLDLAGVADLLGRLVFEPVFTAHPTEATRRSLIEKELEIAKVLVRRLDPSLTPEEDRKALDQIRAEVTTAWQTDEHPFVRPTVRDEMEHVLYHVTDVIYRIVPPLYEDLRRALTSTYGEAARELPLPDVFRCASWVGGDMDGNPYVSAATIRETLVEQRRQILRCYRSEVRDLGRHLSQSLARIDVSEDLAARLDDYRSRMPEEVDRVPARHRDMPYRMLLRLIGKRLALTGSSPLGYRDADGLREDLELIEASLRNHRGHHAGAFAVRRLLRRVRTFGFHLATLDVRQDSRVHRDVLARAFLDDRWSDRPAAGRLRRVLQELEKAGPRSPDPTGEPELLRALETFAALGEAKRTGFGPKSVGPYIVSMTQGADDVMTVLLLARWAGLEEEGHVPLDVAPLFETVPDLEAAPEIMDGLLSMPSYREHLSQRGDRQVVMVGYSDSNKDGGLAAARWALQRSQAALAEVFERHGVGLTIFHGRGGTISRGGGKTHRAVQAAPRGSVDGHLRVTEQGEVINAKYGLRGIALRTLEVTAGAVCLATAAPPPADPRDAAWHRAMADIADHSRSTYRALVYEHPDFLAYFRNATPIDVIERMMIGSRPASRRSRQGLGNLRAIPWVFSWTQSRHILPGWYGLGSGLAHALAEHGRETLETMAREWRFLRTLLEDVEMVLAKADLDIAAHYADLAGDAGDTLFPIIQAEFEQTRDLVLGLQGRQELLEGDPALRRSIRLRNPYVDPMSLMQIDLLRRWRDGGRQDEDLLQALLASVHGIAQGLQNTG
ncbi:MAG: phosphoenolpyruvate carboxylase [Acidobacteriota bacterium]